MILTGQAKTIINYLFLLRIYYIDSVVFQKYRLPQTYVALKRPCTFEEAFVHGLGNIKLSFVKLDTHRYINN